MSKDLATFLNAPAAQSAKLVEFEHAEVVLGIVPDTYFLVVSGTKPYANMVVELSPLVYVRRPEYWEIEVVGILPGIGLPATQPYPVSLAIDSFLGTKGVEVVGANGRQQIDVP